MHAKFRSENLKGMYNLGDTGVDESIILKFIPNKWVVRLRTGFSIFTILSQ
jgi:hypothetical protein